MLATICVTSLVNVDVIYCLGIKQFRLLSIGVCSDNDRNTATRYMSLQQTSGEETKTKICASAHVNVRRFKSYMFFICLENT